jgi:hypothetical protein
MGVDPIGGAEIDHAQERLISEEPRGVPRRRMRCLERGALRERVPRGVIGHARELGAI